MKTKLRYYIVLLISVSLFSASCKQKVLPGDQFKDEKGTYFSIKQFSLDEWTTHIGEPVVFRKTVTQNGKSDTEMTHIDKMDWRPILAEFVAADISDKKFLGLYTFSQFDDDFDNTHNFLYVADNKDLYTQKLLISMDIRSMKVKGLYVETFKHSFFNERVQKLYYSPVKTIQIQEYNKPWLGSKKDLVITYDAL